MEKFCEICGRRFNAQTESVRCCKQSCSSKLGWLNARSKNVKKEQDQPQSENASPLSRLKIIKGDLLNSIKRVTRTKDLLNFSQSIFWPDLDFSEEKELELQLLIANHFSESKDVDKTFRELVERTVLAKRWFEEEATYRSVPSPEQWFDIDRISGLYFTHRLYGKMLTQRNTIPSYQLGITILSEAILKYCEQKNVLDIYAYRVQFIRLNRMDLLQYYFNAVMHIQFINL